MEDRITHSKTFVPLCTSKNGTHSKHAEPVSLSYACGNGWSWPCGSERSHFRRRSRSRGPGGMVILSSDLSPVNRLRGKPILCCSARLKCVKIVCLRHVFSFSGHYTDRNGSRRAAKVGERPRGDAAWCRGATNSSQSY
jgi:hypothetical protein